MVSFFAFSAAASATDTEEKVIRVGDVNIISSDENSAERSGYVYDYLLEISKLTGWKYEYVTASWEESLAMLERGELDLLTQAQYSEERGEKYGFSRYEMGMNSGMLVTSDQNDSIYYNDYEGFQGKTIGAAKGTQYINLLQELAETHHFTYQLIEYDYTEDIWKDLHEGRIDMMLTESVLKNENCKIVAQFMPEPIYFIVNRDRTDLLAQLDDAMETIQSKDINFNTHIYEQHTAILNGGEIAVTREEAEYIRNKPVLRLAYNNNWNPVSYQDKETGEYCGITADILRKLEEDTGIRFEFVPTSGNMESIEMLLQDEIDVVYGVANRLATRAVQGGLMVSDPYVQVPLALAKREDKDLSEIRKIALPQNVRVLHHYAEELYLQAYEIISYEDTQACMDAVNEGKADAVYENIYILNQFGQDEKRYADIDTFSVYQMNVDLCLCMREEDSLAISAFNKAIAGLNREEVSQIILENTVSAPQMRMDKRVRGYILIGAMLIGAFVILEMVLSVVKIIQYAFKDTLTGFSNETRFLLRANRLVRKKKAKNYAIVSLDIDHFKMVNNMWNFETGNHILKRTAQIIRQSIRDNEFFCRKSDDHFLICMFKTQDEDFHLRLMQILYQISHIPKEEGLEFSYAVSCGVCDFTETNFDIHQAIGWASMARKQAKQEKDDFIVYYDSKMQQQAIKEQEIVNRMEEALTNREFCVYYQPQIQTSDETIAGAEALARWIKPDGRMVYPDEFIPVFEKNGFITKLDLYIFEEVCRHIRAWLDEGSPVCRVSVNVSQVHLRNPDFYLEYLDIMEKYRIPSEYIELELTESTLFKNKEQMISLIYSLKNVGIKIAMDDFGSGYSSLNLMKDLPIDYLKLDREFFNTSLDSSRGKEVIKSVSAMAERLHICVVAEGVETREQVDFLREIDCDIVQGYFYYKPLSTQDFEKLKNASN